MACAQSVRLGFFPLDEELALLPSHLTPTLASWLVRLSAWMPFTHAAALLGEFAHTQVSEATAQRVSFAAGAAYVELQTAATQHILNAMPSSDVIPERLVVSVDGAMVPLIGGEWAEVKTLVVGEPSLHTDRNGTTSVRTDHLSSFSRLTDAQTFTTLATVETFTRGIEQAKAVAAVTDGAVWIQDFVDLHCQRATRILDFPHAAQRICAIAQTAWGEDSTFAQQWQAAQLHALKHLGPGSVLAAVQVVCDAHPSNALIAEHAAYLSKRAMLVEYPTFQKEGWPIGSGIVESANKLVVQARLKGAGMHWHREHVNPMLALRNIVCSDRWQQAWPQLLTRLRARTRTGRRTAGARPTAVPPTPPPVPPVLHPKPPSTHPWRRPACAGGARHNAAQRQAAII